VFVLRMHRIVLCLVTAVVLALGLLPAASASPARGTTDALPLGGPSGGLPLGPLGLPQTQTTTQVAPGVTYARIERGYMSPSDSWTVEVDVVATNAEADALVARLTADGFDAYVHPFPTAPDDPTSGTKDYAVRSGRLSSQAQADSLRQRLLAAGYSHARTDYTSLDGSTTTGPWILHVLTIDPASFQGRLEPHLATEIVPGREALTSIAARTGAIAGINGGYFVVGPADGTPGDLAGLSVIDGRLISEAVNGRTDFVVTEGPTVSARVARLSTIDAIVSSDGAQRELDGLNRVPGLIRSCGGVGGDAPTQNPLHDFTCTDSSEVILYTPDFGTMTPSGDGYEVTLDSSDLVVDAHEGRGTSVPPGGSVLAGTDSGAQWLRDHARVGDQISVNERLLSGGQPLCAETYGCDVFQPTAQTGVVNGGPRLLGDGAADITAYAEGFVHPGDPSFYYHFGEHRNPRTLAGVRPDGTIVLVVADGRYPDISVGLSFAEEAGIMQAFGARDAVNLDGGGSSTVTIGSTLVNHPSDTTGERPIGDALLLLP
jgi:Phosphodiester glycosidase/SPOR domain